MTTCNTYCACKNDLDKGENLIEVHKNLLTVCRIPLAGLIQVITGGSQSQPYFSQVLLTYEVILINKSCKYIHNLGVSDSLAAIAYQSGNIDPLPGTTSPFVSSMKIYGCPSHIRPASEQDVITSGGQLLKREKSHLPPFSTTKIVLSLALSAPDNEICEIRQVQNSVCIDGTICGKRINTIVKTSPIWTTNSDISFLIGLNININIPVVATTSTTSTTSEPTSTTING
jgi:hypothetical protein